MEKLEIVEINVEEKELLHFDEMRTFYLISTKVRVPYDYKNAFKRKFKAKWNKEEKVWEVPEFLSETKEFSELEKYVEMKNKRIENGTATKNTKKKRKKSSNSSVSEREAFEDYCADNQLDYLLDTNREEEAYNEFRRTFKF
jgi:hypothetical protein